MTSAPSAAPRNTTPPGRGIAGLLLAAALGIAALTSCGSGSTGHAGGYDGVVEQKALHDSLPASVQAKGLTVLTDASYAPASSFGADGHTIIGFEPDLGAALGAVLGVKVRFVNTPFDEQIGLVSTNRANLLMSAMTDTAEREKRIDFVDYFTAGTALVVPRSNPKGVSDLMSLCGLRIGVEAQTVQEELLAKVQKQCDRPMAVHAVKTNDQALLLLRTGDADAVPMDLPPAEHLAATPPSSDQFQLASDAQYEPAPYGIGVARNQPAVRMAVQAALVSLMRSGAYTRILGKWHVESGALHAVTVNAAGGTGSS